MAMLPFLPVPLCLVLKACQGSAGGLWDSMKWSRQTGGVNNSTKDVGDTTEGIKKAEEAISGFKEELKS